MRATSLFLAIALLAQPFAQPFVQPAAAQAQSSDADILVRSSRDRLSNWREAETEHVIVLSDGKQADLVRIAHNLERLHFLLSILYDRLDASPDIVKPRITLVGDGAEFDAMDLQSRRAQSGPYPAEFPAQAYYDPREDGPVAALSRLDQKLVLQRGPALAGVLPDLVRMTSETGSALPGNSRSPGPMPDPGAASATAMQFGGSPATAAGVNEISVLVDAESRIYAAYARHFLQTYLPAAYPRWYVDGFGELFSTFVAKSGEHGERIEYGRAPGDYSTVIARYARYPVAKILSGDYLADRNSARRWTPYHAWVLTHMLSFDEARRKQLSVYLGRIARGDSPADAAQAFGDLDQLQKDLIAWDNRRMPFDRISYPAGKVDAPTVHQLTEGQAAFVKGRLELGSRVELPPESSDPKAAKARARAISERDSWLARLRRDANRYGNNLEAQLLLAEAECRSGNPAECVAAADRALVLSPGNTNALSWKGWGQVEQAGNPADIKAARALIARANRTDPLNPAPLLAYYRSFRETGAQPPEVAVLGLAEVVRIVPAAPGPRLELAEALVQRGLEDAARRLLAPVTRGAWKSPESEKAAALLQAASP